jgi:hypothetical protein
MIGITRCFKSLYYSSICLDAWEEMGYSVEWFEATVPETMGDGLIFSKRKFGNGNKFTETEKAIWYSHHRMWESITEPTYIIEHDTYPIRRLVDQTGKEAALFSMFPRNVDAWLGAEKDWLSPGSGYYITPETASKLISNIKNRTIRQNVDGYIVTELHRMFGKSDFDEFSSNQLMHASCFQIQHEDIGTSAKHNEEGV